MAVKGKDDPVEIEVVRKLAELLNETGLGEIEVERGDLRVRVARGGYEPYPALHAPALTPAALPTTRTVPFRRPPEIAKLSYSPRSRRSQPPPTNCTISNRSPSDKSTRA